MGLHLKVQQKRAFLDEQKEFLIGDEMTHWANHPAVKAYYALKRWRNANARRGHMRRIIFNSPAVATNKEMIKPCATCLKKIGFGAGRIAKIIGCKTSTTTNLFRKANKEKELAYWRAYHKKRWQSDPEYRIQKTLRNRLKDKLCGRDRCNAETRQKLCGCSMGFLKKYLESQFVDGMSWENYGMVWHIDHITPCAAFDLTKKSQQRKCFHFSNLRPLWAKENMSKGAKRLKQLAFAL